MVKVLGGLNIQHRPVTFRRGTRRNPANFRCARRNRWKLKRAPGRSWLPAQGALRRASRGGVEGFVCQPCATLGLRALAPAVPLRSYLDPPGHCRHIPASSWRRIRRSSELPTADTALQHMANQQATRSYVGQGSSRRTARKQAGGLHGSSRRTAAGLRGGASASGAAAPSAAPFILWSRAQEH